MWGLFKTKEQVNEGIQNESIKKANIPISPCKESDFMQVGHTIRKVDGSPITDEELPFVQQMSYNNVMQRRKEDNVIRNNFNLSLETQRLIEQLNINGGFPPSGNEEIFIGALVQKANEANLKKSFRLVRASNKMVDVTYAGYPIGKIKLTGKKTKMQILKGLESHYVVEHLALQGYINNIDNWILYIKKTLRTT